MEVYECPRCGLVVALPGANAHLDLHARQDKRHSFPAEPDAGGTTEGTAT